MPYLCGKDCIYATSCAKQHVCVNKYCSRKCILCIDFDCTKVCDRVRDLECTKYQKPPFVCSTCSEKDERAGSINNNV